MKRIRSWVIVTVLIVSLVFGGIFSRFLMRPARTIALDDILKVGGVILVVSTSGNQINTFIKTALGRQGARTTGATKVVPIYSVGRGAYIGAAQVVGLPENVQATQGVAAVNVTMGNLSGTGLVPISTRKPSGDGDLARVSGVGVSAIIDMHI